MTSLWECTNCHHFAITVHRCWRRLTGWLAGKRLISAGGCLLLFIYPNASPSFSQCLCVCVHLWRCVSVGVDVHSERWSFWLLFHIEAKFPSNNQRSPLSGLIKQPKEGHFQCWPVLRQPGVSRYYYANLLAISHCKIPKKTNKKLVPFLSASVLELNCQVGLALISLGENTVGRSTNLQMRHWEGKLPLLFCVLPITLPLFDHQCGKKERKRQEQRQIGCWFTFAFFETAQNC